MFGSPCTWHSIVYGWWGGPPMVVFGFGKIPTMSCAYFSFYNSSMLSIWDDDCNIMANNQWSKMHTLLQILTVPIVPHNSLPCMFNTTGCPIWHHVGVFPPSDREIRSLGDVGFAFKGTNIEHNALPYDVEMCFKLWQIMGANVASYYTQEWMATTASISIFQHTSSNLFSTMLKFYFTRVHIHGNVMPRSWERPAWCSHSSNKSETCVNIMLHHVGCPMYCEASKVVANHHNSIYKAYILAPPNTPTTHPKYYTCESATEVVLNCVSNLWAPFLPPPYVSFVWRESLVSLGFALKLVGQNKRRLVLESAKQIFVK